MTSLAFAPVAVTAVLGTLHLVNTLHDFGSRSRYFCPRDWRLLEGMRRSRTAIAPRRDYWSGVLGFNLSHGSRRRDVRTADTSGDHLGYRLAEARLAAIGIADAVIAHRC